jgi:hypothetical protein
MWLRGTKEIFGMNPESSEQSVPAAVAQSRPNIAPPVVATPSPSIPLPTYEDSYVKATGMPSSLGIHNSNDTVIPVKLENITNTDLYVAHDSSENVIAVANTGESSAPCDVNSIQIIRNFSSSNNIVDKLAYSRITPHQKLTLDIRCSVLVASTEKANFFNINIPLIRLENDKPARFTVNLEAIPISR